MYNMEKYHNKKIYTSIACVAIFVVSVFFIIRFYNRYSLYNIKYDVISKNQCVESDGSEVRIFTYLILSEGIGYSTPSNSISIVARKNGIDYEIFRGFDNSSGDISVYCDVNYISININGVFTAEKYETEIDKLRIRYEVDRCSSDSDCSSQEARQFLDKIYKLQASGQINESQYKIYKESAMKNIKINRSFSEWSRGVVGR